MSKPPKKPKVAPPVKSKIKRQSLKLTESDWFWLKELAQDTGSLYSGKASWRRLVARIARGELKVVAASSPAPPPCPAPVAACHAPKAREDFASKFPMFAQRMLRR